LSGPSLYIATVQPFPDTRPRTVAFHTQQIFSWHPRDTIKIFKAYVSAIRFPSFFLAIH
jgi:hypothetical protein